MIYALFAIAVGVAVLAGWLFDVPLLKSPVPGVVTMKANTALALVLAGGSLLLLSPPAASFARTRAGQVLALIVALIGALTLGEFVFGWQLGIDELLFKDDPAAVWTKFPGRMSVSAAAAFFLLGLALFAIDWEPRRSLRPAELVTNPKKRGLSPVFLGFAQELLRARGLESPLGEVRARAELPPR